MASGAGHQWTARECPGCGARYPGNYIVCPLDATPLAEVADGTDPLIGEILGECYEIVRVIGYGGMATVYEAHHTRLLNKRFAVKLLLPEFAVKPELVVRFAREAETASRIEHANIVEVYDVHRTKEGTPYIVCEYLEGKELGVLLDHVGRLQPAMVVEIACQICDGLAAAHAAGVVHRDVKPENVFLIGEPDKPIAKLLDFGISKIAEADGDKLTRTGLVMGTPSYMPPEQARGAKVDLRADVYGVGAILYRALTGRLPFSGDDPTAVLAAVLTKEPERPRAVEPSVPEGLELIIEHAMAKDRERRYPTIDALREDLQRWAESEGVWKGALQHVGAQQLDAGEGVDSNSVARASRHARRARPFIVVLSVLAFVWLCAVLLELILASSAALAVEVTLSERRLVFVGVLAVIITPAVFWSRHLVRRVWQNSVRALELAHLLTRVIGTGLAGLAVGALAMTLVVNLGAGTGESFMARTIPLWLSLIGGGLGWAVAVADRRSADRRSRWRAPMLGEPSPQSS
jgi:serine/threonine-protein kinase